MWINQRSLLLHAARNRIRSDPRLSRELKDLAEGIKGVIRGVNGIVGGCDVVRKGSCTSKRKRAGSTVKASHY